MDGRHGNRGDRFNALQAAAAGVTKSYAHERPSLRCRAYDVHPDMLLDAETTAERLVDDLLNIGGEVEIAWTEPVSALVCFAEDLVEEQKPLMETDVWLVSAVAWGHGSSRHRCRCCIEDAGASFHLLGRTPLMEVTKHGSMRFRLEAEKMALRERMIEASSSGKVTMVEWNRAWDRMMRHDVQRTLARIQDTGNLAQYHAVDVMDAKALTKLGANLGHAITGVVHGAGLEESKLVADKTHEAFDRVVRVKVDGWTALMGAVEASARSILPLRPVSPRWPDASATAVKPIGAAANSVLDAEMSRRRPAAHAVLWPLAGPVGATWVWPRVAPSKPCLKPQASRPSRLKSAWSCLLARPCRRQATRAWLRQPRAMDTLRPSAKRSSFPPWHGGALADPQRFPFIKVAALDEDARIVTQTTLSIDVHPFLVDHATMGCHHPGDGA